MSHVITSYSIHYTKLYENLCNDQVRLAEKYNLAEINMVGCIRTILGEVLAEFNDLDRAIQHARQGVKIAEGGQNLVFLSMSYLYLMRVLFSKKDLAGAEEVFDKVLRLERKMTRITSYNVCYTKLLRQ